MEGEGRNSQQSALMSLAQPKTEDGSEQQATKPRFLFLYKNQLSIVEERPSESMDDRDIQVEPVNVALPGTTELPELNLQLVIEPILEPAEEELDEDETDGDEDEDEKAPDIKESKKPAFKASKPSVALTSQRSRTVYVNMDNFLSSPLQLRTRQTGDRLHPLGMASEMRLKNYFINRGISRFKRDDIPLLAIGTAVLWAAGVGISEHLRVDAYNEATHKLSIEPIPEKKEIEFEVPVENMANQMENQQDNFEQHQQSDNYDDDEDIDENTLEETQFDENYEEAPLS